MVEPHACADLSLEAELHRTYSFLLRGVLPRLYAINYDCNNPTHRASLAQDVASIKDEKIAHPVATIHRKGLQMSGISNRSSSRHHYKSLDCLSSPKVESASPL